MTVRCSRGVFDCSSRKGETHKGHAHVIGTLDFGCWTLAVRFDDACLAASESDVRSREPEMAVV